MPPPFQLIQERYTEGPSRRSWAPWAQVEHPQLRAPDSLEQHVMGRVSARVNCEDLPRKTHTRRQELVGSQPCHTGLRGAAPLA